MKTRGSKATGATQGVGQGSRKETIQEKKGVTFQKGSSEAEGEYTCYALGIVHYN